MKDLPDAPPLLNAEEIYKRLGSRSYVKKIFVFDTIDSTNTYSKTIVGSIDNQPTLVLAEKQTHGKGRFNRRWQSEKGKNLTFSLIVESKVARDRLGVLPLCVAESVARAIEKVAAVPVETKWPNDLLVDGKKLCGILLESVTDHSPKAGQFIIVGIGFNVNQQKFPATMNATSLYHSMGTPVDRSQLLFHIINKLQWLTHPPPDSDIDVMLQKWKTRCSMLGKNIVVESGKAILKGLAKTVAQDGALIVKIGAEDRKVYAGDVTIVKM